MISVEGNETESSINSLVKGTEILQDILRAHDKEEQRESWSMGGRKII
jgi:hypothetical protein